MPGSEYTTEQKTENSPDYVVMPDIPDNASPDNGGGSKLTGGLSGTRGKFWMLIGAGVIVLAILISLGYLLFTKQTESVTQNEAPEIVVGKKSDVRSQDSDSDNDGLNNSDEAVLATDVNNSDSDSDGLADGDEVHVYGSDPKLIDTDGDTFNDSQEVSRGYSPKINTHEKASDSEKQTWLANIVKYGIHEPTISALKSQPTPESVVSSKTSVYSNGFYNYSIEYPPELEIREEQSGQIAALKIAGSEPAEDIAQELFVIALAGTKETLSLKEWAETQYSGPSHELVELTMNGEQVIQVREKGGECGQDKTFFAKNNLIISVTWNCNTLAPLEPYYQAIVESFLFKS